MASDAKQESSEDVAPPIVEEWSLCQLLRRNWITIYFIIGLLLHIGCLVVLQITETGSNSPSAGALGITQMLAARLMYVNVLSMCVAVFLESHLYCRRLAKEVPPELLDCDFDIQPTEKQAKKELAFISVFARRYWQTLFRCVGQVGGALLKYCSCLLLLCSLVNMARIFAPNNTVPEVVSKYMQFSLAIVGLTDLLAALLVVLNWVFFRYRAAKTRVSQVLYDNDMASLN